MLDHDYTTRELFNSNFFKDWRKVRIFNESDSCLCAVILCTSVGGFVVLLFLCINKTALVNLGDDKQGKGVDYRPEEM